MHLCVCVCVCVNGFCASQNHYQDRSETEWLVNHGFLAIVGLLAQNIWEVFQKAGYVTHPGKLTPQMTPSVVTTLPVGCCNIVNQLGGIPGSRFSEKSELFNPENRQTQGFPFQKER